MLDNLDVRKAIVAWLQANSIITDLLVTDDTPSGADEIREVSWQGENFFYPNIRVTSSVSTTECEFSDVDATISFFSEELSSRQSIEAQGIIAKQMHKKSFVSEGVQMSAIVFIDLPDAVRVRDFVWQADVVLSIKASSA